MLQNRSFVQPVRVEIPPRCSSPLSLINSEPQARPGAVKGREADPLTAKTGPYNLALRERGWVKGRVAAAEPPSIRALDSLILFPQGQPSYYLS